VIADESSFDMASVAPIISGWLAPADPVRALHPATNLPRLSMEDADGLFVSNLHRTKYATASTYAWISGA
jgi:hypothetical protein